MMADKPGSNFDRERMHGWKTFASSTKNMVWPSQPTITSSPLFAIAYHGGANLWVAGRGGAILRRNTSLATVRIPTPKLPPMLRGGPPKLREQPQTSQELDLDDIPRATRPDK